LYYTPIVFITQRIKDGQTRKRQGEGGTLAFAPIYYRNRWKLARV
jgi:hypothetical protein